MGVFQRVEPAAAIQIGDGDAAVFDEIERFLEPGVVRPARDVHLFVATEGDITAVARDRRRAQAVVAQLFVDDRGPAGGRVQLLDLVAGLVDHDLAVGGLGHAAHRIRLVGHLHDLAGLEVQPEQVVVRIVVRQADPDRKLDPTGR